MFLLVAFGLATPLFYFSAQLTNPGLVILLLLAGSYAPALGAWMASRRDGEVQAWRERLTGWTALSWVGFALLAPSLLWLAAFGILSLSSSGGAPLWLAAAALPVIMLVNFGEEIGWRGYALPWLLNRFDALTASLVLGCIWALFHAALYFQRPVFGALASVIILLLSVILAWMFVNTRKILPGTLLHAVFNAWTQVFVSGDSGEYLLVVMIVLLLVVCGYLLLRHGKGLVTAS
jgi:membrane protease YdiL (CAAX protease family)